MFYEELIITSKISEEVAEIRWYRDGVELVGETKGDLLVKESGTYKVVGRC